MADFSRLAFWLGLRDAVSRRISTISAAIPQPRDPEPPKREHGDSQPLRVPLFDLTDVKPKKKEEEPQ